MDSRLSTSREPVQSPWTVTLTATLERRKIKGRAVVRWYQVSIHVDGFHHGTTGPRRTAVALSAVHMASTALPLYLLQLATHRLGELSRRRLAAEVTSDVLQGERGSEQRRAGDEPSGTVSDSNDVATERTRTGTPHTTTSTKMQGNRGGANEKIKNSPTLSCGKNSPQKVYRQKLPFAHG
jgi:hypothetical protein